MEERKVQKSGGTYTVSLPRDWAESVGLTRGEVVDIHTHIDGILVVEPNSVATDTNDSVVEHIRDTSPERVRQTILAAYTAGYTKITLAAENVFSDAAHRVARNTASVLAGVTVTHTADTEVQLEVLLSPDEVSPKQLVRQLSFVACSMYEEAVTAVVDTQTTSDLSKRDNQSDRVFAMMERSLSRALSRLNEVDALGTTRPELFELWSVARDLERVADHAERINRASSDIDELPSEDQMAALRRVADQARQTVDSATSAVVNGAEASVMFQALETRVQVRREVTDIEQRIFDGSDSDRRIVRILDSIKQTAEHGGNIAERGLQRAMQSRQRPVSEHKSGRAEE